jgi:heme exporter protein A
MAQFEGLDLACRRGEAMIFEAVEFTLGPGDALWLAGPNGSGKSSLLRMMAGLLAPAGGVLRWDGKSIAADREGHRGRLRYLGHLDAVKAHLSVAENLAFWADYWGIDRGSIGPALQRLGLARLAEATGRRLSAGQRRRLALARLALAPAALWLLDEPSAALDAAGMKLLGELIAECRRGGGIVVFSSHDTLPVSAGLRLDLVPMAA